MKTSLFSLFAAIFFTTAVFAQENTPSPAERYPNIPPFTLQALDSSNLTRESLAGNRKTMIMYFSPDCDHCQHQTEAMLKKIELLKGVQIVMTTYQPFEDLAGFYEKYHLVNYPQIKLGRDTKFFFVPYYKIQEMPFMALYDAKGTLLKTYEGNTDIEKLAGVFEKKSKKKS